jgi:hypothetical protein
MRMSCKGGSQLFWLPPTSPRQRGRPVYTRRTIDQYGPLAGNTTSSTTAELRPWGAYPGAPGRTPQCIASDGAYEIWPLTCVIARLPGGGQRPVKLLQWGRGRIK